MRRSTCRQAAVVLAASGALALAADWAWAAIPDDKGIITSCYNSTSGALRVIDAAKAKCASSERSLTWGQRGPAGPTGPTGPAGPAGAAGVSGYELTTSQEITVPPDQPLAHWEHCSDGKVALGGGYYASREEGVVPVSRPLIDESGTPVGWEVSVVNDSPDHPVYLRVYAICALAQ